MGSEVAVRDLDAQSLIVKAVEKGASVETVERLVALAREVREVQAKEAWHKAKVAFKGEVGKIKKSSVAKIFTARGSYSYAFASLDDITAVVDPVLAKHGLSYSWKAPDKPEAGFAQVACVLSHTLGHSESSGFISIPVARGEDNRGANPAQQVGISHTYAKRYTLCDILGIVPEDDTDAGVPERGYQPPAKDDGDMPVPPEFERPKAAPAAAAPVDHDAEKRKLLLGALRTLGDKAGLDEQTKRELWSKHCGTYAWSRVPVPRLEALVNEVAKAVDAMTPQPVDDGQTEIL